jgi:uroporphyrinogen decarboxylase
MTTTTTTKKFLKVFEAPIPDSPPMWLMRQAGRYLPEYREIRAKAPSFMDFCWNPDLTVEATLQPIRRFGFDAAIIFSDILVVPDAMGHKVRFDTGEGPRMEAITTPDGVDRLGEFSLSHLEPVFEALRRVKSALPSETALIGFCGAPWTIASYMIAGKGTPDQAPARGFAYRHPAAFQKLIDRIVDASIVYLNEQIKNGAEVVQIFDSWAGVLPALEFERWCEKPVARLIAGVKAVNPQAKIIAFPRAAHTSLPGFGDRVGADAIGLDTSLNNSWAKTALSKNQVVQGNLDPLVLIAGGDALRREIDYIRESYRDFRHIFNLGHGILPETPIENVELLVARVRGKLV